MTGRPPTGSAPKGAPAPPTRPKLAPPNQILVVEDQLIARQNLKRTLEYYQHGVLEAADGRQALQVFHRHRRRIGMVLLDLTLPDVPAIKVLAALRTLEPRVRVAVCTEESVTEVKGSEELEGVVGVLRKPIRADRLLAIVRRGLYG